MKERAKEPSAIFHTLDKMKPIYDVIYNVILFLCKIMLIVDILITVFSVLGRHVPFIPDPAWTEEMVLTLMSYMAVLSAALAIRRQSHIRMTIFDDKLPKKVLLVLELLADLLILILGIFMVVVGLQYATKLGGRGTYVSMPWLSRFWMYFPVPLAGLAMILFEIELMYRHIRAFFIEDDLYKDVDREDELEAEVSEEEAEELRHLFSKEDES